MGSVFFVISKLLSFMLEPLVIVLLLMILGLRFKNPKKRRRWFIISAVILYFLGNGFIYNEIARLFEPSVFVPAEGSYEVVVVPGGFAQGDPATGRTVFYEAADRFNQALWLYHTGRVKMIMVSGGSGSFFLPEEKEALAVKRYMRDIGIPDSAVIVEYNSRNTHENAVFSKKIVDSSGISGPFLLCTSALHMPRAIRTFRKAGWEIDPCVSNKTASGRRDFSPYNLLVPRAKTISDWNLLWKEWLGLLVYKITGKA